MCPGSKEGQRFPGLDKEEWCQQIRGDNASPIDEGTSGVVCPDLGSSVQERPGHTGVDLKNGQKGLYGTGAPLLRGKADTEPGLFNLEKRRLKGISSTLQIPEREGAKRTELVSFQQYPVSGHKATDADWNMEGSLWTLGNILVSCSCQSPGTGCSEMLWSPLLEISQSRPDMGLGSCSGWPCWSLDWAWWTQSHSGILWIRISEKHPYFCLVLEGHQVVQVCLSQ